MSSGNRNDRGALVALALIAALVVLGLSEIWSRQAFDSQVSQQQHQSDNARTDDYRPPEADAWPRFTPSDTYAQWVMAALAGVATVVSIIGIIWIRQTLEATRDTASAAVDGNKIARLDRRAWVGIEALSHSETATCHKAIAGFSASVTVKNYGETPATNVAFAFKLVYRAPNDPKVSNITSSVLGDPLLTFGALTIFPGKEATCIPWLLTLDPTKVSRVGHHLATCHLVVAVGYRVAGDPDWHHTVRAYQMLSPDINEWQEGEVTVSFADQLSRVPDITS